MPKVESAFKQRYWLLRFMTETPFHGFAIAAGASNFYEVLTWLVMILGCISIATFQTFSLIKLYISEPTMTVITLKYNDGSVKCKNSHICFSWEFNPDTLVTDNATIDQLLARVTDEKVSDLKSSRISTDLLEPPLLQLIVSMISQVISQEANIFSDRMVQKQVLWGISASEDQNHWSLAKNIAIYRIYQFFVSRHVSMAQLMRASASLACQLMTVKVTMTNYNVLSGSYNNSISLDVCNPKAFASLGELGFCMFTDPTNEQMVFRTTFDYLLIESNPQLLYSYLNESGSAASQGSVLLDLIAGRSTDGLTSYLVASEYMKHTKMTVDVHGHYRSYNGRRHACSNDINNEAADCKSYCRAVFIAQICRCWPLYFVVLAPKKEGMRYCLDGVRTPQNSTPYHMADYHRCLSNRDFGANDPSYDCQQSCLEDCEHVKLTFVTEQNTDVYKLNYCTNCTTTQFVKFGSFAYPYIEEVLAKSLESFIAEFGGLVGLWLGGSFIAFSHVFVFLAHMLHGICVREKRQDRKIWMKKSSSNSESLRPTLNDTNTRSLGDLYKEQSRGLMET